MQQDNYYKPMSSKAFADIKVNAIAIWNGYDDTHGYATEKIDRIRSVENVRDNAMYIIAMFDRNNVRDLLSRLETKTIEELNDKRLPTEYQII